MRLNLYAFHIIHLRFWLHIAQDISFIHNHYNGNPDRKTRYLIILHCNNYRHWKRPLGEERSSEEKRFKKRTKNY